MTRLIKTCPNLEINDIFGKLMLKMALFMLIEQLSILIEQFLTSLINNEPIVIHNDPI